MRAQTATPFLRRSEGMTYTKARQYLRANFKPEAKINAEAFDRTLAEALEACFPGFDFADISDMTFAEFLEATA